MYKQIIEGKKAVFFDLDGTIVDTLPMWQDAFWKVIQANDLLGYDEERIDRGTSTSAYWKYVQDENKNRRLSPEDLTKQVDNEFIKIMSEKEDLEVRYGFWPLLEDLKVNLKLKVALVSNAHHRTVDPLMQKLEIHDVFDYVITADEVKKKKPNPEIYKKASNFFKIKPSEVLVFEDSPAGAKSAAGAGMEMIIIYNGNISMHEYPLKSIIEFMADFQALPGNFEKTYLEYLREEADKPENQDILY